MGAGCFLGVSGRAEATLGSRNTLLVTLQGALRSPGCRVLGALVLGLPVLSRRRLQGRLRTLGVLLPILGGWCW